MVTEGFYRFSLCNKTSKKFLFAKVSSSAATSTHATVRARCHTYDYDDAFFIFYFWICVLPQFQDLPSPRSRRLRPRASRPALEDYGGRRRHYLPDSYQGPLSEMTLEQCTVARVVQFSSKIIFACLTLREDLTRHSCRSLSRFLLPETVYLLRRLHHYQQIPKEPQGSRIKPRWSE